MTRATDRRRLQRRRERILLLLLLLTMLLAGILGLYLASRGLHPRQLRRRIPSGREGAPGDQSFCVARAKPALTRMISGGSDAERASSC